MVSPSTVGDRRYPYEVPLKRYTYGDGATLDDAGITEALSVCAAAAVDTDAVPILKLHAGRKWLTRGNFTLGTYLEISGQGPKSVIKVDTATPASRSLFQVTASGANHVFFRDFAIHGQGASLDAAGIRVDGIDLNIASGSAASYCGVENVWVKEMSGYGIRTRGAVGVSDFRVFGGQTRDCYLGNLRLGGLSSGYLRNHVVRSSKSGTDGLLVDSSTVKLSMRGCHFAENSRHSVYLDQPQRVAIEDCDFDNSGHHAIYADRVTDLQVGGNRIDITGVVVAGGGGIVTDGGQDIHIAVNKLRSLAGSGIACYAVAGASPGVELVGNYVASPAIGSARTDPGILLSTISRAFLTGNRVVKNAGTPNYAIEIAGATSLRNRVILNDVGDGYVSRAYEDAGKGTLYRHLAPQITTYAGASTVKNYDNFVLGDTSGAGFALTLPDAADFADGAEFFVKRVGANNLVLAADAGDAIDGAASVTLGADGEAVRVVRVAAAAWRLF